MNKYTIITRYPVFRWAKEQGADYILFDADGTHYDHLPKFDW